MTGPGWHGVDLVLLAPGDVVVTIEVKGTLVPGRVPRLSAGKLVQMSAAWVGKVDNPGMAELGLASTAVHARNRLLLMSSSMAAAVDLRTGRYSLSRRSAGTVRALVETFIAAKTLPARS